MPYPAVPGIGIVPANRSRNRLLVVGVEKARLYVTRNVLASSGLNTSAARGEYTRSSSRLCLSTRSAATRLNDSESAVSECRYPPISLMMSSFSLRPVIVPPVRGSVRWTSTP